MCHGVRSYSIRNETHAWFAFHVITTNVPWDLQTCQICLYCIPSPVGNACYTNVMVLSSTMGINCIDSIEPFPFYSLKLNCIFYLSSFNTLHAIGCAGAGISLTGPYKNLNYKWILVMKLHTSLNCLAQGLSYQGGSITKKVICSESLLALPKSLLGLHHTK